MSKSNPPIFNAPRIVSLLLGANFVIFIVKSIAPYDFEYWLLQRFAFIAAPYTEPGTWLSNPIYLVLAPITYMFLHVDFIHLAMNMAMLLAFGTVIARRMGTSPYLTFYLICGVISAASWVLFNPGSTSPVIGGSGAISGMFGAVGRLSLRTPQPGDQPFPYFSRRTALSFVLVWILLNFVFGALGGAVFGVDAEIAWEAHLGGFVAGYLLIGLFDGKGQRAPVP
jgi:membrane associated rhomboid family serine protease